MEFGTFLTYLLFAPNSILVVETSFFHCTTFNFKQKMHEEKGAMIKNNMYLNKERKEIKDI